MFFTGHASVSDSLDLLSKNCEHKEGKKNTNRNNGKQRPMKW